MAALLGMLTGIGGGMTRDVLLAEIPTVLRADLYAIASLAGAVVVVIGAALGLQSTAVTIAARSSASGFGSSLFAAAGTFRSPTNPNHRPQKRTRREMLSAHRGFTSDANRSSRVRCSSRVSRHAKGSVKSTTIATSSIAGVRPSVSPKRPYRAGDNAPAPIVPV